MINPITPTINIPDSDMFLNVRYVDIEGKSTPVEYKNHVPEMKTMLEDLASMILDPDGGKVMVAGNVASGKSYLIEQLAYNFDYFLEAANKNKMHFIKISRADENIIEKIPGGWKTYLYALQKELKASFDEICFVTEAIDIASHLSLQPNASNVILELNPATFEQILNSESSGQTKVWGAWDDIHMMDLLCSKKSLVDTIYEELYPKYEMSNNYELQKKSILVFVNYTIRHIPELVNDDGKIIVVPGVWVKAIKRLIGLLMFSSDENLFNKRGEKVMGRAIETVFKEYESFFESEVAFSTFTQDSNNNNNNDDSGIPNIFDLFGGDKNGGSIKLVTSGDLLPSREKEPEISESLSAPVFNDMTTLAERIKETVIGQDKAVEKITESLFAPSMGIHDDTKPLRSMLFLGPTGVGKTKVALTLAQELLEKEMNVVRLDMSEYTHPADASKLFGAAPGYVGYTSGGILTNSVKENPHSIILLDEVEKAHPEIWDSFLQVFDAGRLTSGEGETISFHNTVIIMTSNLGVKDLNKTQVGFMSSNEEELYMQRNKDAVNVINKAVKNFFKPEFVNRIDETIIFNELSKKDVTGIVRQEINLINDRIKKHNHVLLEPNDEVVNNILSKADVTQYGARDIQRVIVQHVSNPVAKEMIKTKKPVSFFLTLEGDEIKVNSKDLEIERGKVNE